MEESPKVGIIGSKTARAFTLNRHFQIFINHQCMNGPLSPHHDQYYGFPLFFMFASLVGEKWYFSVTLISIFLTCKEVEHLFICLLAFRFAICKEPIYILCPLLGHL